MKIGVDLDSVLANFCVSLHEYHNEAYATDYPLKAYNTHDLRQVWNVDEEEVVKRLFDFYDTEYLENIPLTPGAQKAVKSISDFHTLYLITSRPDKFHHKTQNWIAKNFPGMFTDVLCTNQVSAKGSKSKTKSEICLAVGAQIMIDDHLVFAYDCAEANIDVLLYDQPWNRKHKLPKKIKRMHSWKEIETYINSQK